MARIEASVLRYTLFYVCIMTSVNCSPIMVQNSSSHSLKHIQHQHLNRVQSRSDKASSVVRSLIPTLTKLLSTGQTHHTTTPRDTMSPILRRRRLQDSLTSATATDTRRGITTKWSKTFQSVFSNIPTLDGAPNFVEIETVNERPLKETTVQTDFSGDTARSGGMDITPRPSERNPGGDYDIDLVDDIDPIIQPDKDGLVDLDPSDYDYRDEDEYSSDNEYPLNIWAT